MKIKYSALVSAASGKLNGSVASHNRAGAYLRNKTTPLNPQTNYQQALRSTFGSFSSNWRSLTQAQQQSFINIADEHPYTDMFGDVRRLTGANMHIKLNQNLFVGGADAIDTAVSPQPFPVMPNDVSLDWSSANQELSIVGLPEDAAGGQWLIYATPPIGTGRKFVKNQYRLIDHVAVGADTEDITDAYVARFGAIETDKRYFVKLRYLDISSGFVSPPYDVFIQI